MPDPLVARVLSGGSIRVELPIQGIDPDGDSTRLLRFPSSPTMGSVVEQGDDYFIYEASPASPPEPMSSPTRWWMPSARLVRRTSRSR